MPIDGSLMIDNPVQSSFPPSRVFKIIQQNYNEAKAFEFLRRSREALFVFNRNISDKSELMKIVDELGLDGESIVNASEQQAGIQLLNEDFELTRNLGARAFPTIVMINEDNRGIKIVGARPLETYVEGLQQVLDGKELQPKQVPPLSDMLDKERLLFSKEIEVLYAVEQSQVQTFVEKELSPESYRMEQILGEVYIIR